MKAGPIIEVGNGVIGSGSGLDQERWVSFSYPTVVRLTFGF